MIRLDVADLVVIAGQALGIGADAALAQVDVATARAALAQARTGDREPKGRRAVWTEEGGALATSDEGRRRVKAARRRAGKQSEPAHPDRADAAAAAAGLVHALLRHRPFPRGGEQVAVAAGLQFLSLNGWRADLAPPAAAAVVVEALAAGQLSPDDAAAWLTTRLSPQPALLPRGAKPPHTPLARVPAAARMLISAMLTLAVGGLVLLATACARPAAPAAPPHGQHVERVSPAVTTRPFG